MVLLLHFVDAYAFGRSVIRRPVLDTATNYIYVPDQDHFITKSGQLLGFQVYVQRVARFSVMILRRGRGTSFSIVAVKNVKPYRLGLMNIRLAGRVRRGDYIAYYYPGRSVIPFTYRKCRRGQKGALYLRNPRFNLTNGRRLKLSPLKTCRDYSIAVAVKRK